MAAISITASSVLPGTGCVTASGTAGASITAGMPVYIDTANSNVIKPTDSDASDLASTVAGIALHAAGSGQPIQYATDGAVTYNAVLTAGKVYVAGGGTAGDINPVADLTTNWRTSIIGVALSTTSLRLRIYNSLVSNA